MSDVRPLDQLIGALRDLGSARWRWDFAHGAALAVIAGPGALLLWFALDVLILLPALLLLLLFAVVVVLGLWVAIRRWLPSWFRSINPEAEARFAERQHGKLDNLLIGALQLGAEAQSSATLAHSRLLVDSLVQRAATAAANLKLADLLDLRPFKKHLGLALAIAVAWAVLFVAAPGAINIRMQRLGDAWNSVYEALFPVEMIIKPGDKSVIRGEPLTLSVSAPSARRNDVTLIITDSKAKQPERHELHLVNGQASFTIPKVSNDFTYNFVYGGHASATYNISVGERPEIAAINYELSFPIYTGLPSRVLTGRVPRIQALAGTGVLVSLVASTELRAELCYAEWQGGSKQPLVVSGRSAHFNFNIDQPGHVEVHLCGKLGTGFEMLNNLVLDLIVDKDRIPSIELRIAKDKLVMEKEAATTFTIPWLAEDDYGVAEVTLNWRIEAIDEMLNRPTRHGSITRSVDPVSERAVGRFTEIFKTLDPPLEPGDRITYELTAKDNNTEPGVGRSNSLEIVVVSPDLGRFVTKNFGFDKDADPLGGDTKIARDGKYLIAPTLTVTTEAPKKIERVALSTRQSPEAFPSGSEDAVGAYFRLLSGGKPQ